MLDIDPILIELARERPVFHSEADFQHVLAWEIREHLRDAKGKDVKICLEVPVPPLAGEKARRHIDILVADVCAIEVKYKTKPQENPAEGFDLRDHSAHDFGRYEFLRDIERLEQLIVEGLYSSGYAIMLTNDQHYWEKGRFKPTQDAAFRIHDGRIVEGTLKWADDREYRRKLSTPLVLKGRYALCWRDYSDLGFRYLVVEVREEGLRGS